MGDRRLPAQRAGDHHGEAQPHAQPGHADDARGVARAQSARAIDPEAHARWPSAHESPAYWPIALATTPANAARRIDRRPGTVRRCRLHLEQGQHREAHRRRQRRAGDAAGRQPRPGGGEVAPGDLRQIAVHQPRRHCPASINAAATTGPASSGGRALLGAGRSVSMAWTGQSMRSTPAYRPSGWRVGHHEWAWLADACA